MNELDPDLKRLLKLSVTAAAPEPEQAPFGFSVRVAASANPGSPATLLQELQQTAWGIACTSLALLVCGALVLLSQRASPAPGAEISSALNFVANSLLQ
jgi:hypothetical protein